jgi:uncharacterized protein (TIGR03083 family)
MSDTTALLTDAAMEALAFADLYDTVPPADRALPTPCSEWSIADLAEHVAAGAFRDAESFHRARLGTTSPPGEVVIAGAPAAAIRLSVDHLRNALDAAPAEWPDVPMAFGAYSAADALQCLIIEFGVHADDLRIAVGDDGSTLSSATRRALFGFGERYLLLQAEPLECPPVTFTLSAPAATMSVTWTGSRWRPGASAAGECRITGTDDAIARLMLRRLDVTDPRLDVLDPARLAPIFASAIRPL